MFSQIDAFCYPFDEGLTARAPAFSAAYSPAGPWSSAVPLNPTNSTIIRASRN